MVAIFYYETLFDNTGLYTTVYKKGMLIYNVIASFDVVEKNGLSNSLKSTSGSHHSKIRGCHSNCVMRPSLQ